MAFTTITPLTTVAESLLVEKSDQIWNLIYSAVKKAWDRPDEDIIVQIEKCPTRVGDPKAQARGNYPDVLIRVETTDELGDKAESLVIEIAKRWNQVVPDLKAEIWIRFFHTWGTTF